MANEKYSIQVVIEGKNDTGSALDSVNQDLSQMDKKLAQVGQNWNSFKNAVGTAVGAVGIAAGVGAVVAQVYDLGRAGIAVETTFNQVSGGADKAAASLANMRTLTGGVIADVELMRNANSLLVTGVASTNEQAADLVNLGARLGQVMGVDAAESIQNLNSALLNNSFMRLDTLGISAAEVRERVAELKREGLDMSAAFAQAVNEIGTQKLEDLGAAAASGETALARLTVRAQNFGQEMAEGLAVQLDVAATSLEQLLVLADIGLGGTGGIQALEDQKNEAAALAAQLDTLATSTEQYRNQILALDQSLYATDFAGNSVLSVSDVFNDSNATQYFIDNADVASQFATAGTTAGTYFRDAFQSADPIRVADARAQLESIFQIDLSAYYDDELASFAAEADVAITAAANAQNDMNVAAAETAVQLEKQASAMASVGSAAQNILSVTSESAKRVEKFVTGWQAAEDSISNVVAETSAFNVSGLLGDVVQSNQLDGIEEMYSGFRSIYEEGQFATRGSSFFSISHAQELTDQADQLMAEYERLQDIASDSPELITDEQVARARDIADSAQETARQATANAEAWERASLAQLAGASDGGRQNEFYQGVLAQVSDPEQRAALERQFNLQSGVETANTQVIEYAQSLNAAIIEEFGVGRGAQAGQQIATALEQGMMQGLQGEDLKNFVESQVGFALSGTGGGGQQVTVQSGEGYIALSQRTGISQEDLRAANGNNMLLAGQVITVGDGTSLISVNGTPQDNASGVVGGAAAGALGQIGAGLSQAQYFAPQSAYTYYDPATGTYTGSDQQAAQAPQELVPETAVTNSTLVASNMDSIEESFAMISESDLSETFTPVITDVETINTDVDELEASMARLTTTAFALQVPLSFVFDNATAELLSRNSQVVETVRLVLQQLQVPTGGR